MTVLHSRYNALKEEQNQLKTRLNEIQGTLDINYMTGHRLMWPAWPPDDKKLISKYKTISTQSYIRMISVLNVIRYITKNKINGDIVECGVYKGITPVLCAIECLKLNNMKHIWSYDTYEGVPSEDITEEDMYEADDGSNKHAKTWLEERNNEWCKCSLSQVEKNVKKTNYPDELLYFIKGKVQDTIPAHIPDQISFLRLDMDLGEPTKHALNFLWDKLNINGVLQIDDYGFFKGVRNVIDEFFSDKHVYIHGIDMTAIGIIKLKKG